MARIYLSLGSNLGDRRAMLRRACELLRREGLHLVQASSLYETEPVGLTNQPAFLNAVVEFQSGQSPLEVLAAVQAVEGALGRQRSVRWGPRTLDVDILLYDDLQVDEPGLRIPHPRMHERRFVLVPLLEIAPNAAIPGIGSARACLDALDPQDQPVRLAGPPFC